jgi:hypothetical protein
MQLENVGLILPFDGLQHLSAVIVEVLLAAAVEGIEGYLKGFLQLSSYHRGVGS